MKKIFQRIFLIAFCLLCTLFVFHANMNYSLHPPKAVVDSSHAVTDFYGVSMDLKQESVFITDEKLVLTIQNNSDFAFGCGEQWQLERYEEGTGFVLCPYEEPPSFTAVWYDISSGGTCPIVVDLTYFGRYLCPGRYRAVVGPCVVEEEREKSFYPATAYGSDRFVLCLEFNIA